MVGAQLIVFVTDERALSNVDAAGADEERRFKGRVPAFEHICAFSAVPATEECGLASPRVVHVIGRLGDLAERERASGEQYFADVVARWSFAANDEWLVDGVRTGEPFLQISAAEPGSVLAWELERLRDEGCVRVGPFWLPTAWFRDGERYRRLVRLVAEHVLALPPSGDAIYVPKACGELEPLLGLWPHVLVVPTSASHSLDDLIVGRAWPVHPLGVASRPTWADGRMSSPAEFFFHDVDHARFKVREDLLARGIAIPDAYRAGSTFDAERGEHRCFIPQARPHVSMVGWQQASERALRVRGWLDAISAEEQHELATAARWLLFELVHEKSLPIDVTVLSDALATPAHAAKLQAKHAAGFYERGAPSAAAIARLPEAREWLRALMQEAS